MKKLYILRHAKSDKDNFYNTDKERPLNDRGWNSIEIMSKKLKPYSISIDIILSSDSVRTTQTIHTLSKLMQWNKDKIIFDSHLYHSSLENLLQTIHNIDNSFHSILLVGHNPGLTYLTNTLTNIDLDNLPTCACVGIQFSTKNWEEISKKNNQILFIEYPKKNN